MPSLDSLNTRRDLKVGRKKYAYYSLRAAEEAGLAGIRNPRRVVRCQDCAGGQLAGQPLDSARERRTLSEPAGSGA